METPRTRPSRITIVGCGGSGKTVLARAIGHRLELPVVDLDCLLWRAPEGRLPADEAESVIATVLSREQWVIDGDHLPSQPARFAAADLVVFLDFPRWLCLWRLLWRALRNLGRRRHPFVVVDRRGSRRVTVRWVWSYQSRFRPAVATNLARYAHRRARILRRPRDVTALLRQIDHM